LWRGKAETTKANPLPTASHFIEGGIKGGCGKSAGLKVRKSGGFEKSFRYAFNRNLEAGKTKTLDAGSSGALRHGARGAHPA